MEQAISYTPPLTTAYSIIFPIKEWNWKKFPVMSAEYGSDWIFPIHTNEINK